MASTEEAPRPSGIAAAAGLTATLTGIEQDMRAAQAHWDAGQNQQAELLCLQILNKLPDYLPALHLLGLIAHTVGKLPEAVQFMRSACAPANAPALFLSNGAEIFRQAGLLEEAEKTARRAVALEPANAGAQSNLSIILQESGQLDESLAFIRAAIAAKPEQPEFHNTLGNTLQRKGLLVEAKSAYEQAIALHPEYDAAHANLARLLMLLGDLDAALSAARQAIDINPHCTAAYIHTAAVHLQRKQYPQALQRLDALLSFMPTHPQAWQLRARLLTEVDDTDDALAAAQQALALAPESADALFALAKVLEAQGKFDEALTTYRKAATGHSTTPDAARIEQTRLLIELGRIEEARVLLQELLARTPPPAQVWLPWSSIKTFSRNDADIARMEGVLAQGERDGLPLPDRIGVHFALGKAYMDASDISRALDEFDKGNRLQRAQIDYDAQVNATWMQSIIAQVSPELLRTLAAAGAGNASEMPIFIVGMPRSGTSLVEQILASHPDVHGAGELRTIQSMIERIVDENEMPLPYPALMSQLQAEDFTELGTYYVDSVTLLAQGKRRVVDKMPLNFLYAGLIHAMLPNARIIHTRRNAVDTCMSCYSQAFDPSQKFTFDLAELGAFYRSYTHVMQHWRTMLPASRLLEIDYEDVVNDLEGSTRKLLAFCGLPWDDACLDFHRTERRVKTASMAQVRQPIYRSSIGRWEKHADRIKPLLEQLSELSPHADD